jgi:hypothetical protein
MSRPLYNLELHDKSDPWSHLEEIYGMRQSEINIAVELIDGYNCNLNELKNAMLDNAKLEKYASIYKIEPCQFTITIKKERSVLNVKVSTIKNENPILDRLVFIMEILSEILSDKFIKISGKIWERSAFQEYAISRRDAVVN